MKNLIYLFIAFVSYCNSPIEITQTEDDSVTVTLDFEEIKAALLKAPLENMKGKDAKGQIITLTVEDLDLYLETWNSPIFSKELQKAYPNIKSFKFQDVNNASQIGRITLTDDYVNIYILSDEGTKTIAPADLDNPEKYEQRFEEHEHGILCSYDEEKTKEDILATLESQNVKGNAKLITPLGATLRTFNLAIVTTLDFVRENGGNPATALASLTTSVNGVNALYERDFSVRFNLLNPVFYTSATSFTQNGVATPSTYPFVAANICSRTQQASAAVAKHFAVNSYDIGHAIHSSNNSTIAVGTGGVAGGTVCSNTDNGSCPGQPGATPAMSASKARGWSSGFTNVSVNLFAHEIGHQFRAPHTFIGTGAANCTPNGDILNAVEIGSGSTIMSYQGICDIPQNLPGNGSYFHSASLEIISNTITNTANCFAGTPTGNTPPTVNANPFGCGAHTIPPSTPFILTGNGMDADGDNITYTWDQRDLPPADGSTRGEIGLAAADNVTGPLIRSFFPTASPVRSIPELAIVNANNALTNANSFEVLPAVTRTLNFELVARDNRPGGGGVSTSALAINVDATVGAFSVIAPNGGENWTANTPVTVTWSNNTAGICANVTLQLSVDGGLTYPVNLAANEVNDGTWTGPAPTNFTTTGTARVRVICASDACVQFYDISNNNFTITNNNCTVVESYVCPIDAMTFNAGDPGLNLTMTADLPVTPITAFAVNIAGGAPVGQLVGRQDRNTIACAPNFGQRAYQNFNFKVTQSGNYTLNTRLSFSIFSGTGYNPAMPCNNWLEANNHSTGGGGIGVFGPVTLNLNACTNYEIVVWDVFGTAGAIAIAGPGIIYTFGAGPPASTAYTYVAVNTANNVVAAQSPTSDFTALAAGTYKIYGANYKSAGNVPPNVEVPANWVTMDANAVQNAGCVRFSTSCKTLTVTGGAVCNLTSAGETAEACNNNGTGANGADDYITFSLNPVGANLGGTYNVTANNGGVVTLAVGGGPATGVAYTAAGVPTAFRLQGGSANGTNYTITVTDATNAGCSTTTTVMQNACSNTCNLTSAGETAEACNNNGTGANGADDYITFSLNPVGANLGGTYNVTANNGGVVTLAVGGGPATGVAYTAAGVPTAFRLQGGSANGTNYTITVTDATNGGCTTTTTVMQNACSNACNLTSAGETAEACNNNGTGVNANDDYITFSLNPVGANLGGTYNVTANNGGVVTLAVGGGPATGVAYTAAGVPTAFRLQGGSANGTNYTITVTDATNGGCTTTTTVMQNACSNACNLTSAGETAEACNNNGTGVNANDDYITFSLNPVGANLGGTYNVTANNGGVVTLAVGGGPATGVAYTAAGVPTAFRLQGGSANGTNYTITVTDATNGGCSITTTVMQNACSNTCNLTSAGETAEACNNNGTGVNANDDYITFSLNPVGANLGATYNVTANNGGVVTLAVGGGPATGVAYTAAGVPTAFRLQGGSANGTTYTITVTDATNGGCSITTTVMQNACSNTCNLTSAGETAEACNNNGTGVNGADDFITFSLNPVGANLGGTYNVTANNGGVVTLAVGGGPATGVAYTAAGVPTAFRLQGGSANGTNYTITVTDATNGGCTTTTTVMQNACSNACNLTSAGETAEACNNNGTGVNANDDYITFSLNPVGANLGATYNVTANNGGVVTLAVGGGPATGVAYTAAGVPTAFRLQGGSANGTTYTITVSDATNGGCSATTTVMQNACSNACNLTSAGETLEACNNNGTGVDGTDDYITFSLNPVGANLGGTYNVTANNGGVVTLAVGGGPATGVAYTAAGVPTAFRLQGGSANGTTYTITVSDATNGGCSAITTVMQNACSNACNLTSAGETLEACNNNGTGVDGTDDYITFSLTPVGANLGATYNVTASNGGIVTLVAGGGAATGVAYGGATAFRLQDGSANGTTFTITVTDATNGGCITTTTVMQNACSVTCSLTSAGKTIENCNNNGTGLDGTDDFITFSLNPVGANLGATGYNVTANVGTVTLAGGGAATGVAYGGATAFRLQDGSANGTTFTITVTDATNGGCTTTTTVMQAACSTDCSIRSLAVINISPCNNSNTEADAADDFFTADVQVTFVNQPTTGTLNLSGDGTATVAANGLNGNHTFNNVRMTADGGPIILTASFSAVNACSITNNTTLGNAPAPCSPLAFCSIANVVATPPACNGTQAEFSISATVVKGSGNYNVIDLTDNSVVGQLQGGPTNGVITVPVVIRTAFSNSLRLTIQDANDVNCRGNRVDVQLPMDCVAFIPSMGQWALFIMGLFMSVIGLVFIWNFSQAKKMA